jgi:hypothetical protein
LSELGLLAKLGVFFKVVRVLPILLENMRMSGRTEQLPGLLARALRPRFEVGPPH